MNWLPDVWKRLEAYEEHEVEKNQYEYLGGKIGTEYLPELGLSMGQILHSKLKELLDGLCIMEDLKAGPMKIIERCQAK